MVDSQHLIKVIAGLCSAVFNIKLDLMQLPLPYTRPFTVVDYGEVTLSGRPLTFALALLEAERTSSVSTGTPCASADTYVDDLLHCHGVTRLRDHRNTIEGELDAIGQLAILVVLKAVRSQSCDRQ
jgi:hypothetical protein